MWYFPPFWKSVTKRIYLSSEELATCVRCEWEHINCYNFSGELFGDVNPNWKCPYHVTQQCHSGMCPKEIITDLSKRHYTPGCSLRLTTTEHFLQAIYCPKHLIHIVSQSTERPHEILLYLCVLDEELQLFKINYVMQ